MSGEHNESEASPDDIQLMSRLEEHGLDPDYWLNEIKTLGIKNIHALQYVQAEDCAGLENKIHYPWQKKALWKLFDIPDSSVKSAELQEKQAQALKERNEQTSKTLEELKALRSEKKNLQDEVVSTKIDEMQKLLEIPTESSVPPDKTLGNLVDYFEKQYSFRVEATLRTDHYSDKEVIKNSSGGLALEGIFRTKNTEELFRKRETLLCVPDDFHLLGPEQISCFSQKEFTSHEEETSFRKTVEKVGFSLSSSIGFCFKGFSLGFGTDTSESLTAEVSTNSLKDHSYICTTRYNYVPMASYHFSKNQLRLSQNALSELKDIEKLILINSDTQIVKSKCEDFFQIFGSHVNLGPIHFGGIFWWKASMEGVHKDEIHEAKASTGQALNSLMNCGYSGIGSNIDISDTNTHGSAKKSKTTQLEKQIQVSVTKTGGPLEADSLSHWKAGLVTSNKSWSVIDRGFQLTPVWKIIVDNHKNEFKDAAKLSSCLMDSYQLLTGLSSEVMVGEQLLIAIDRTQLFLECVKSWDLDNATEHLKDLMDFKQKINELTKSYSPWVNLCLSDKSLQSFLVKVAEKYKTDLSIDANIIKTLIQKIIKPHIYSTEDFPDASVLMKWIYDSEKDKLDHIDIREFTELSDVLHKSIDEIRLITADLKSCPEEVHQAKVKATIKISLSINSFLRIMRETEQTEVELLILCISNNFGFCVENYTFRSLLGCREIEFLKDQLHEAYEEYTNLRKQCADQAQVFVLYTGLTSPGQYNEMSSQQKRERLHFMRKHFGNVLSSDVNNILHQNSGNWEEIESKLRAFSIGYGLHDELQAQDLIKQLSHLCQKEEQFTKNADIVDVSNTREDILMLLKDLDLEKYYPQKMKTADFHMISRATMSGSKPVDNKELPVHFLQKLLMLDYSARYVHCENKSKESQSNTSTIIDHGNKSGLDNHVQYIFSRYKKSAAEQKPKQDQRIHPMDVQMAIFHCADDFMRQYIYTKLSSCQFALPLLVPNPNTGSIEFPLWAFQEVKKKWQKKHGDDHEKSKSNDKFIKDTETPIVSFIRLGPSTFSKSQKMNWLMSKHKHDIFYHRDCEGSTKNSVLMDGVTEIAWYCPGGREDDAFDDCTAFVNLHGDARDHGQQLELIHQISSVLVVVLTESDSKDSKSTNLLNQLSRTSKPCVFLLVDEEFSESVFNIIGIIGKNEAELKKELRTKIQELLLVQKEVYSLNKCAALARRHGFIVDEDKVQCKVGKEQAGKLLNLLKTEKLPTRKTKFLPLQGNMWLEWCKQEKKLRRLGGKCHLSIEQQRSNIESRKEASRRDQLKSANPLNNFVEDFLRFLHSNKQGSKMYFLQWFKIFLDELSSEALSGLNQEYHDLWSSVKTEKQIDNNETISDKRKKLQTLSNQINSSKFGLEHILRELGQIYEALEANIQDQIIGSLPKLAANLMISGYPIEMMDGDAQHVPLKWITAILQELKDTLGDKKLFVLSVLGIQSTGKSTLLNAMFGLQFAVSAGRCTRGAFMQLVKVEEELQREMSYDYVLVVDTEGLRSAEVSGQNALIHDNELATFVIGVGNLTLINIFGENPSEMQDILQIAVQAFLRMKMVNLHPSCLFVHQNVGEITAMERNMEGRRCLLTKLDKMTVYAAQQEESDATCFNDVIKFDVDCDVHYFAHLWEGDPPMAPSNPRYSQNVQTLRKVILNSGKGKDNILSISAFSIRVSDLWEALLNENFVFSFKNSLEIGAHNQLEVKYGQWAWRLRKSMLKLQGEINNQIQKEEIKSIDIMLISNMLDEVYSTVKEELNVFFVEDKEKNILDQWRVKTKNRIATLKDELIEEMMKKANERIALKEKNRKIIGMKGKYEDEIYTKSKDLALSLKGQNLSDKDLEVKFTTLWNCWILAVTDDMPPPESPDIHKDLDDILVGHFGREVNIINTISESSKWRNLTEEFSNFVSSKQKNNFWKENLSDDTKRKVTTSINVLKRRIDEYIDRKEQEKMDYQSSYFHEIVNIIRKEVNFMFDKKFKFLSDYVLYATLFLCKHAAYRFKKLSDAYRKANDPVHYLKSKRAEFYKSFKVSCEGKLEVASLANIISKKLQVALQQAVYEKSAIDVSNAMKCNYSALNGNRSNVEFYLLKSLAEKENFQNYLLYFTDPKSAVKEFIRECIEGYLRDTSAMSDFLHSNVDEFRNIIIDAVNLSTVKIQRERGNINSWLDAFCKELGNNMNLSYEDLKSVKYQNIGEIDFLLEAMTQAVDNAVQKLHEELSTWDMVSLKEQILTILTDNFPGCWEKCPFCGAICTHTGPHPGTGHSVRYHRPTGFTGRWTWCFGQKLRTDICTSLVSSYALFLISYGCIPTFYKNYLKAGPPYSEWSIRPDSSSLSYWKWVTCRFQSDIERCHDRKFETIPVQWKQISKVDVIAEIEELIRTGETCHERERQQTRNTSLKRFIFKVAKMNYPIIYSALVAPQHTNLAGVPLQLDMPCPSVQEFSD